MNVAKLTVVENKKAELLQFSLTVDKQEFATSVDLPEEKHIQERAPTQVLTELIPNELRIALKQWRLDSAVPGVIAIVSDDILVHAIQWELLPVLFELQDVIIARVQSSNRKSQERLPELSMVAAGWPTEHLPFIDRELEMLAKISEKTQIGIDVITSPSLIELMSRLSAKKPAILHLIPQATKSEEIVLAFGSSNFKSVAVDKLAEAINSEHEPDLIVINTCDSGSSRNGISVASVLSKVTGCMSVGWSGIINDAIAADFAAFLYRRLAEGNTVIQALRNFISLETMVSDLSPGAYRDIGMLQNGERRQRVLPVVWCPSIEALELGFNVSQPDTKTESRMTGRSGDSDSGATPAYVSVELELRNALNPALLKNGTGPIARLALDANSTISNVALEVSCDTGSCISTVKQTVNLLPGLQPIKTDGFQFPALYELAERSSRRRLINFTVTCRIEDQLIDQITKSVLWMGLAEWLDRRDVWPYIPAFVLPNADGILDVIDKADSVLKTIASPQSSFDGYQSGDREKVSRQIESIFNTLRDDPFQLSYINPPASPVYEPDSMMYGGQLVRFPDDVISRKRGTCHDLSLFLAGCAEHIGVYPLVILIAGHTFFGFWNDQKEHHDYWPGISDIRKSKYQEANMFGGKWCLVNKEELVDLVELEKVTLIEATKVTDRNAEYSDAVVIGRKTLDTCPESQFDIAVDIRASRFAIQPV